MNLHRRRLATALALIPIAAARAQATTGAAAFPSKPIKLVVGFPPGGSADAQARLIAAKLGAQLGQQVIVDNRPGAGGNIGADAVAKAPPDGHTLLLAAVSAFAINPWLYPRLPFDPARDFAYIGQIASFQGVVVVGPDQPMPSMKALAAYARAHPGQLVYGSPGNGTTPHLAAELFRRAAGVELQHAPYRGDAPALTDVAGGQLPVAFVNLGPAIGLIRSGRVRALAVTGDRRASTLPEVPTLEEAGFAHAAVPGWSGLAAPAGTPPAIVERLAQALKTVAADAEFRQLAEQQSAEVRFVPPAAFAAQAAADRSRFGKLVKDSGITLD
ncbi:Bug family tripartite tricarboxylate transporter substrate binding protein [Aquabacterium sp.]|uniref:Bug family tripartite tricarboxylate transporter substrate binding protein n=1 Tax=Aquabacterium sp. TaxID=1872578 RepID=UPI00378416DB